MKTIEYRFEDKSGWGDGPWQSEPDKLQWQDVDTGLPCLIVRGPSGALCGYVGVGEQHPWFGKSYDGAAQPCLSTCSDDWHQCSPSSRIEVHGGLTFADACAEGEPERGICHRPDPGESDHVWWFGFDCAHLWDLTPKIAASRIPKSGRDVYRDVSYVQSECTALARQLAAAAAQ